MRGAHLESASRISRAVVNLRSMYFFAERNTDIVVVLTVGRTCPHGIGVRRRGGADGRRSDRFVNGHQNERDVHSSARMPPTAREVVV